MYPDFNNKGLFGDQDWFDNKQNQEFQENLQKSLDLEEQQNSEPLDFEEIQNMKRNVVGRMFSKMMIGLQANLQINGYSYQNIMTETKLNGYRGMFQEIQSYLVDIASFNDKPPMNKEKLMQLFSYFELFDYIKHERNTIQLSLKKHIKSGEVEINIQEKKLPESDIRNEIFQKGSFHLLYKNNEATIRYKYFEQDLIMFFGTIIENHF